MALRPMSSRWSTARMRSRARFGQMEGGQGGGDDDKRGAGHSPPSRLAGHHKHQQHDDSAVQGSGAHHRAWAMKSVAKVQYIIDPSRLNE